MAYPNPVVMGILCLISLIISIFIFLGMLLVAELPAKTSLKITAQFILIFFIMGAISAMKPGENFKFDMPDWEARISEDFYSGWIYIAGTCGVFSWISYLSLIYTHLQFEVHSEYGRHDLRHALI